MFMHAISLGVHIKFKYELVLKCGSILHSSSSACRCRWSAGAWRRRGAGAGRPWCWRRSSRVSAAAIPAQRKYVHSVLVLRELKLIPQNCRAGQGLAYNQPWTWLASFSDCSPYSRISWKNYPIYNPELAPHMSPSGSRFWASFSFWPHGAKLKQLRNDKYVYWIRSVCSVLQ